MEEESEGLEGEGLRCSEVVDFMEKLAVILAPIRELLSQVPVDVEGRDSLARGLGGFIHSALRSKLGEPLVEGGREDGFEAVYSCRDDDGRELWVVIRVVYSNVAKDEE
jgi:hypothetical protein